MNNVIYLKFFILKNCFKKYDIYQLVAKTIQLISLGCCKKEILEYINET